MKKIIQRIFVLSSLMLTGSAFAAQIDGTAHDLAGTNINDNAQICVYCHTPHTAGSTAPLWNRQATAGGYTMYTSPTIDMTVAGSPQDISLACLSCHDGSLALDALLNFPGIMTSTAGTIGAPGLLGTDLSNDHPISITYDEGLDAGFNAPVLGKVGALQLYGAGSDQVECASCHNVHDNANIPFLRVANTTSGLCLTCHIK